jgi:hypothetical protein
VPLLVVPSGGRRPRPRSIRLLALLACRDEMRFLPGWVRNVTPHVDGVIALDDGSLDGSGDFLESCEAVLEVLREPRSPVWDEPRNHRRLVEAAIHHGADWLLCLDADERVEREFRARAERVLRRGAPFGFSAYAVRLRELWDAPTQYRADGIWGRKRVARLFRARQDHAFDTRAFHAQKAPLQARRWFGRYPLADLVVYHLRMLTAADRLARRARWEALDPEARWQPRVGYAYLTDERGLRLRRIPPARAYVD